MSIELHQALDFDLPFLTNLFNRGFAGYFVSVAETPEGLATRLVSDSIDLTLSRVATVEGRAVGIVYVAARGWQCRIAGMGVVPEARRTGVGQRLMHGAIHACSRAGLRRMVLEVIEQNEPAVALYRALGFKQFRRLVGYELAAHERSSSESVDPGSAQPQALDPRAVARQIAIDAADDLPWQLAAETFAQRSVGLDAYHLEDKAFALIQDRGKGPLVLEAILVRREARRGGWGSRLFHALAGHHPNRDWRIPGRVPEGLGGIFIPSLGFRRDSLSQLEMCLELSAGN